MTYRRKAVRNHHRPTLDALNQRLVELGETPSAGGWENEHCVYAFSSRTLGPQSYLHPAVTLYWTKHEELPDSGWYVEIISPKPKKEAGR